MRSRALVYLPDADGRWAEREVEVEVLRELTPLHLGQRPLVGGALVLRRVLVVIEGHGEWLVEPSRIEVYRTKQMPLRAAPLVKEDERCEKRRRRNKRRQEMRRMRKTT